MPDGEILAERVVVREDAQRAEADDEQGRHHGPGAGQERDGGAERRQQGEAEEDEPPAGVDRHPAADELQREEAGGQGADVGEEVVGEEEPERVVVVEAGRGSEVERPPGAEEVPGHVDRDDEDDEDGVAPDEQIRGEPGAGERVERVRHRRCVGGRGPPGGR